MATTMPANTRPHSQWRPPSISQPQPPPHSQPHLQPQAPGGGVGGFVSHHQQPPPHQQSQQHPYQPQHLHAQQHQQPVQPHPHQQHLQYPQHQSHPQQQQQSAHQQYQHPQQVQQQSSLPPAHNTIEMTREMLLAVLERFSELLERYFDFAELSDSDGDDEEGVSGLDGGDERDRRRSRRSHRRHPPDDPRRPKKFRLTTHGGACMLLHPALYALSLQMPLVPLGSSSSSPPGAGAGSAFPGASSSGAAQDAGGAGAPPTMATGMRMRDLPRRTSTRDVDILMRGFVADFGGVGPPPAPAPSRSHHRRRTRDRDAYAGYQAGGYPGEQGEEDDDPARFAQTDVTQRLKACIVATARCFPGLGADWMNADPDQALPLGTDPATHVTFDPIHLTAMAPDNRKLYTVFQSKNRRLELVSVPPYWSVALKLVRWGNRDWADVGLLLRNGTILSGTQWTPEALLSWLETNCWAMGYSRWDMQKMTAMREKVTQAVRLVEGWEVARPVMLGASASGGSPGSGPEAGARNSWSAEPGVGMRGPSPSTVTFPALLPMPVPVPAHERVQGQVNVRDWARSRSRKRSQSRRRSQSAQRRSHSRGRQDIFIPPDDEDSEEEEEDSDEEDPRGRGRQQNGYIYQNPNRTRTPSPPNDQGYECGLYANPAINPYSYGPGQQQEQPVYHQPAQVQHPLLERHQQTRARETESSNSSPWLPPSLSRIASPPNPNARARGEGVDPELAARAWHPQARAAAGHGRGRTSVTGDATMGIDSAMSRMSSATAVAPFQPHQHQPVVPSQVLRDLQHQRHRDGQGHGHHRSMTQPESSAARKERKEREKRIKRERDGSRSAKRWGMGMLSGLGGRPSRAEAGTEAWPVAGGSGLRRERHRDSEDDDEDEGLGDSDAEADSDADSDKEGDKENRGRGRGGQWHPNPPTPHPQHLQPPQHQQSQRQGQQRQMHQIYASPPPAPVQHPAGVNVGFIAPRIASRNASHSPHPHPYPSRDPSPNPHAADRKRRPPPLNLTPPADIPGALPDGYQHQHQHQAQAQAQPRPSSRTRSRPHNSQNTSQHAAAQGTTGRPSQQHHPAHPVQPQRPPHPAHLSQHAPQPQHQSYPAAEPPRLDHAAQLAQMQFEQQRREYEEQREMEKEMERRALEVMGQGRSQGHRQRHMVQTGREAWQRR